MPVESCACRSLRNDIFRRESAREHSPVLCDWSGGFACFRRRTFRGRQRVERRRGRQPEQHELGSTRQLLLRTTLRAAAIGRFNTRETNSYYWTWT